MEANMPNRWVTISRLWRGLTAKDIYKPWVNPDSLLIDPEVKSAINARADDLEVEAGQPRAQDRDEFLKRAEKEFADGECYYFRYGRVFVYRKCGTENIKDALSFLKDWVTSLIQLETGALAVFGLAAGFAGIFTSGETSSGSPANPAWVKVFAALELFFIVLSGSSLLISLTYGLALLNALPGAMQRVPSSAAARQSDVFSIRNEPWHYSIYVMVERFRSWFFVGVILFALFVLVRLLQQFLRVVYG
jgi:hypothetical protein